MGFGFCKSIKIAPGLGANLNKDNASATVGISGVHYTVNSKGRKTSSVGIPETEVSYAKPSSTNTSRKANTYSYTSNTTRNTGDKTPKRKKGRGCLTAFLVFFALAGIFSLFADNEKPKSLLLSTDTETVYDINSDIPLTITTDPTDADLDKIEYKTSGGTVTKNGSSLSFAANKAGMYDIYADYNGAKSNTITINIDDKKAIEEQERAAEAAAAQKAEQEAAQKAEQERVAAEQKAEEERIAAEQKAEGERIAAEQAAAQHAQSNSDPVVYITNTGGKYHSSGCRFLKESKIESSLSQVSGSYGPCGVCNPPTL